MTTTAPIRPSRPTSKPPRFDAAAIRRDFPLLQQKMRGKPLAYLDNAATSQKPQAVIAAIARYYNSLNANIHRGVYELSADASEAYEKARGKAAQFIGASDPREVIFVRGATEAINLVASSWGVVGIKPGDEIIVSALEHHSNIVPWQMLCQRQGAVLKVIPMNDAGELDIDAYAKLLNHRTRMVAVTHISNALGTINDVERIATMAHDAGAKVLIDGAQSVPHLAIDVKVLGCDFFVFSGHKVFGPTGIGVLWARAQLLEAMPPYQGGGDMIASVTFEKTTYNVIPAKFEAGTPHIAGAIALASAFDYVNNIGFDAIAAQERDLIEYATGQLSSVPGLKLLGTAAHKAAVISFNLDGVHPHDVGTILDGEGVAVRTGHHCCQPVMDRLNVPATVRASFAFYNTREDVDRLVAALGRVKEVFG